MSESPVVYRRGFEAAIKHAEQGQALLLENHLETFEAYVESCEEVCRLRLELQGLRKLHAAVADLMETCNAKKVVTWTWDDKRTRLAPVFDASSRCAQANGRPPF